MRLAAILFVSLALSLAPEFAMADCDTPLLDQEFKQLAGDGAVNLCDAYEDKVILVVNTASKCGYTPQYDGLEKLYAEYKDQGLVVIGFPSNQFGGQEPGTEEEIKEFCRLTYGVKFPMFEKTEVKGESAHPFYQSLAEAAGTAPKWNFHKYLIGRDGKLISDYPSRTKPYDPSLVQAIEDALGKS